MKKLVIIHFICGLLTAVLLFGCDSKNARYDTNTPAVKIQTPTDAIKDSIDILIEQRAKQSINSTIIAGLHFGESRQKVESVLKKKGGYSIQVPDGDKVETVVIRDYDAVYNNGKLVSIVLYANEANLYDALGVLYTAKYGKTKNNKWHFANSEISIEMRERRVWEHIKTNINNPDMYYYDYRGGITKHLTKEQFFLAITYLNYTLLQEMERQQFVKDSIKRKKTEKDEEIKRQKEKELAKKLSTEVPTNI